VTRSGAACSAEEKRCPALTMGSSLQHMADAIDAVDRWPLASATARLLFLRAVCAVAQGADVPLSHTARRASSSSRWLAPGVCVAAVLGDAEHRVAVLGGREGMPRSLGSVYGGSVTRFLGGALRGVVSRVIDTPGVVSSCNGIAVSSDGCTLLVSDSAVRGSHAIHEINAADGCRRRVVGGEGDGSLQFLLPRQVCIAPDGFVFVADTSNSRVQVLTPCLNFHGFIGQGHLHRPVGVSASADVVVVSEMFGHRIAVLHRGDGSLLRLIGCRGSGDGELESPCGLCLMCGGRHVAVADKSNSRVSVFSVDGEFIRHVGVGVLRCPQGVAASAFDELVVADTGNRCLRVFSRDGDVVTRLGEGLFASVAMHDSSVFAVDTFAATVSVLQ
jgi:DNA-binding beta-propeller fold protein YncE